MKNILTTLCLLYLSLFGYAQNLKPLGIANGTFQLVTHILTPFNGMHSGFSAIGKPGKYSAQIASFKRLVDFAPQDGASNPPYPFGFYESLYEQSPSDNNIQIGFSLPFGRTFTIELSVTTNVDSSYFGFQLDGQNPKRLYAKKGAHILKATFPGSATGDYHLILHPQYHQDGTTFLLTQLKIYNQ